MTTILLVADDGWVENDVSAAITDRGARVEMVPDAETAADHLQNRAYDLVIVDMQVGSMGGMAITRRLHESMRRDTETATPIVMLLDRKADEFLARRAGADAYIIKPFTAQQLRATTESLGSPIT